MVIVVSGFLIILVSSQRIAGFIKHIRLPLITGLLVMGLVCGPELLGLISRDGIQHLGFINHIALSFIAFAAGTELYLVELRSRLRVIRWMTFGQMVVTFVLGSLGVFFISAYPWFGFQLDIPNRLALSMLAGTIFVARSPVSAIAVINELRAKGPFTQMIMGVTVLKDALVVILFAIIISIASTLVTGQDLSIVNVLVMVVSLVISLLLGYLLFLLLKLILSLKLSTILKSLAILLIGWGVHYVSGGLRTIVHQLMAIDFYTEPLLICIIASLLITNYSPYRREFQKIITDTVPLVYVAFFTLVGATINLDVLVTTWWVALAFFGIRLISMAIGGWLGGTIADDPPAFNRIAWMPFVTQAGISLGLITVISAEFTEWGPKFGSILIAMVVINQLVGPPLLKWAIQKVHEDHSKGSHADHAGPQQALIFGYEHQSLALARQLVKHGWTVTIATRQEDVPEPDDPGIAVVYAPELSMTAMKLLDAQNADAIVTMKTDEENYKICEMAYEHYGTPEIVVRLNDRKNMKKFHDLGALIVEPSTAMVSLLDHFVRSPIATSLLLGMEEHQDTADITVGNPDLHGMALRNLHLPSDILILATRRRGHNIISTGYTRLRKGDVLTIVGSIESIEKVRLRFE
jgi:Trk K+ transport system NAD-binding subunit/NhaP-type Na+/H+ or K+/H+ antiporter